MGVPIGSIPATSRGPHPSSEKSAIQDLPRAASARNVVDRLPGEARRERLLLAISGDRRPRENPTASSTALLAAISAARTAATGAIVWEWGNAVMPVNQAI